MKIHVNRRGLMGFNGGFLLSIFIGAVESMEKEGMMWLPDEVVRETRGMIVKGG
jgi:hypothetical protein